MQQKEYEAIFRQVIPPAGKVDLTIENTGLSKLNFHGIRAQGRIQMDMAEPLDQYGSGFATLMCIPNDQITIPTLLTEADLNDSNSFIVAIEVIQMAQQDVGQALNLAFGQTWDFRYAPKTSRSCMKGGKLVLQVSNNSPTADFVYSGLLSSFETF